MTRAERSLMVGSSVSSLSHCVGIERRQVVEVDLVLRRFRVFEVDLADLEQGEVALAVLGAADLAFDRVARAQREAADLRGRDVDVVGTGQVVGVGRAQEAEAVLQHLDDAGAGDFDLFGGELLQRREHQLLLAHGAGVLDAGLLREAQHLRRRLELQVFKLHFLHKTLREATAVEAGSYECRAGRWGISDRGQRHGWSALPFETGHWRPTHRPERPRVDAEFNSRIAEGKAREKRLLQDFGSEGF